MRGDPSHPVEAAARPFAGTTAGLSAPEDWRPLFAAFPSIVLVANSDSVDIDRLQESYPQDTLFVFFNKVYKILRRPFDGNALLIARSGTVAANIVQRREVEDVLAFFPSGRFLGVLNLSADASEKPSPASAFGGAPTGHLDLAGACADFYPAGHLPTSGFALALWLCEQGFSGRVTLAGFSGKRSQGWRTFHTLHDWTFEQIVLRLMVRSGKLAIAGETTPPAGYAAVLKRFPDISAAALTVTAAEVLAERLESADQEIDKLITTTRLNRSLERSVKSLKPVELFVRRVREKLRRQA